MIWMTTPGEAWPGSSADAASGTTPIRPRTKLEARSRTISFGLSSKASFVAPARAAPTASERLIFWRRSQAYRARNRVCRCPE